MLRSRTRWRTATSRSWRCTRSVRSIALRWSKCPSRLPKLEPTRRTIRKPFPFYRLRNKPLVELARAVSYRRRIGVLERGQRMARLDTLVKLAGGLEIESSELLEGLHWRPGVVSPGGFESR